MLGSKRKMDRVMNFIQSTDAKWDDDGSKNEEALQILTAFYFALKRSKADKAYKCRCGSHTSYIRRLLQVRAAFAENKYMRACHEIIGLAHFESY